MATPNGKSLYETSDVRKELLSHEKTDTRVVSVKGSVQTDEAGACILLMFSEGSSAQSEEVGK